MNEDFEVGFLPKVQEYFLSELLLENCMSHAEILDISDRLGYSLDGRLFCCTLLTAQNLTQQIAVKNKQSRYQILQDVAKSVGVFCGDHSSAGFQLISARLHKNIAILLSLSAGLGREEEHAEFRKYLHLLDQLIEQLRDNTSLQFRAATSSKYYGIDNIPITYNQALELDGFMTMLSLPDQNLCYDDVVLKGWEVYDQNRIAETKRWESMFLNALERNDFHKIQDLLHEMADSEFQLGRITIQASSAMLYTLLNKIRIVLDVMRFFADPDVLDVFETAPRILYRKSIAEVMEQVDLIFSSFFDSMDATKPRQLPVWLLKMDAYITENFDDPDLNVSKVSDQFGLCAAYAGRLYKVYFGFSVLDRINHLRIEKAVALLQQNMLLKDIAVAVGYENRHRMNRAFQKYVGYTPKEAKEGMLDP